MIRYINCFRKLPGLSIEEFRARWQNAEFDALISKVADTSSAASYSKNLTLQVGMGDLLLLDRGMATPFDGTVEYLWENAQHLADIFSTAQAQALRVEMTAFQSRFIDLANSTAFFTEYPAE